MKKKIFGFLSLLALAIGSLMFSMPLNSNYAYAADSEVVESHYLRNAETQQIESTDLVVAKTVGYGSYIIGTKNVKLTTTPEPAFHLVGWYVGTLGSGEFYDADSTDGKYLVDLENLEFTIINAEESLKINPVCEYIEFVADFSAFEPVVPEGELPEMRTYHLNEQFNQTFNIKNNIDISHVYLNGTEGFASIAKDAFGRATAVTIKYVVTEDVVMTLNYTQLYEATIKPLVKNPGDDDYALATGEESSLLLGTIQATNVFSKLNESTYLVKNSADNSNFTFKIVAVNVSKNIDSRMYHYYNVSQSTPTEQGFEVIDHDFDVIVCYDSVPYTIDFTFALYENGYASIFVGGFNVETTISSQRGITHTITKTDVSNNYGYAFYGFAVLTEQEIRDGFVRERNASIQISIDKDKPSNQHVYMLFTKVAYTLQLTNYNTIDLVYRSNTTYPLNQATLSFDRLNESYSQTIEGGALKTSGTTEFDKYKVTVTDENLKITPITNLGFSITKYKFIVNGVESEAFDLVDGVLTLDLTPEFVQNYVYNDVLSIAFVEEYEYYTVNYYTVSTLDSMSGYVFMASLSATSTDAGAIITEQTDTDLYRTVTISHLKRYSEVTLKSTGEIQTGSVHYNFVKFVTEDGTTTYYPEDAKLSQADVSLMIEGDRSINVVYCVPSVHFSIKTVKTEICDLAACSQDPINKLYLTQGDEVEERLTPEVGQTLSWVIDLSDGRSNIITVYFDTNNVIKFGYSFDSFSLRQSGESAEIGGETHKQDGVYSFRFAINTAESESGLGYNLSLNFVVTDFIVDLNKTNSSTGETSLEHYTINTEQPTITFEMEEGFYVNYVAFGSDEKIEYASLEQTNEYTGKVFSCNLTEFLEELTAYGNTITMHVTLKLHTYTVQVIYGLTNPKGSTIDRRVTYPSIALTYGTTSSVPEYSDNKATFRDVEYGNDISMNVGTIIPGLTAAGWFADERGTVTPYEHSSDWLEIENISSNKTLYYKLTYVSYTINLVVEDMVNEKGSTIAASTMARPVVKVNDVETSSISLFDYLVIDAGALTINGFKLKSIKYQNASGEFNTYVPFSKYAVDASEWSYVYYRLYYKDGNGNFVRNYSSEFVEGMQYYIVADSAYVDTSFNMANYTLTDNALVFTLEYTYADIMFTDYNLGSKLIIDKSERELTPDDFATYTIVVTGGADGLTKRTLDYTQNLATNRITALDSKVEVFVNFNRSIVDDKEYLLSHGVQLTRITMLNQEYGFSKVSDGQYKFTFNVDDIISKISKDGTVQINYTYSVIDKYVTITTNVTDASFYANGKFSFKFEDYGGMSFSDGKSKLTDKLTFLGNIQASYINNWQQYFAIKSLLIYQAQTNINGYPILDADEDLKIDYSKLIPENEYADYGIYISGEITNVFNMRLIDNIVIVLVVEPILSFKGAEVIDGDYYFKPTFNYDATTGAGKPTTLTLGYDISAYTEVQNRLKISYIDENDQNVSSPVNVGRYEVVIGLKEATAASFAWLKEITLSYKIYLDIQPARLHLDYSAMSRSFEKVYDGTTLYNDTSAFINSLRLRDNARLNIPYANQPEGANFIFMQGIVATITYTDNRGVQQATNKANEGSSIKYNITLSKIKLDSSSVFNRNFVLEKNEIVFEKVFTINKAPINILGIVLKDKKWDGTDAAVADLTHVRLDPKGIIGEDDVQLAEGVLQLKYDIADMENPYGEHNVYIPDAVYESLLTGSASGNYKVVKYTKKAKIYRASISVEIENVGTITVFNNTNTVDLIPLDAELVVTPIEEESTEYTKMYSDMARYLANNNKYATGYRIAFDVGNTKQALDNQLTLSLPSVERLTNACWLSEKQAGKFNYQEQGDYILLELREQPNKVDVIFLTNQRVLLELWQVLLIVGGAVVIIGAVIATVLIVRHNKIKKIKSRDII